MSVELYKGPQKFNSKRQYHNSATLGFMAGLFKFGFTRGPPTHEEDVQNHDVPSTSSADIDKQLTAPHNINKRKDCGVKIATIKHWQSQSGDGGPDSGFRKKRPDLTWIRYETAGNVVSKVWCYYCRRKPDIFRNFTEKAGVTRNVDAYIEGTANIKKTNCERHAHSKGHENARAAVIAEDTVPAERPLQQYILRMHRNVFDRLVKLFEIAYFIAKNEQPFTNMSKQVALGKHHNVDLGERYDNNAACRTFTRYNAQILREPLQQQLKPAKPRCTASPYPYHSLFTDGTTDKSVAEREVVYVKIFQNGEAQMKIMGVMDVEYANATAVKESLVEYYKDFVGLENDEELDFANTGCIGACADGASVNFGVHRGMMAQLRNDMPWLVAVHCVAHRLELAVKDSFKNSFFSEQIHPVLLRVFSFYSRSPKRYRELKEVARMKGIQVISLKRAEGTRWVAHRLKAMEAFLRNYPCLITHWEDLSNPARKDIKESDKATINGFLRRMKKVQFITTFCLYMDVLVAVSELSEAFQKADVSLQQVRETVALQLTTLQDMREQEGHVDTMMVNQLREEVIEKDGTVTYRAIDMTGTMEDAETALMAERDLITSAVLEKLDERFADFTEDPVLSSCEVFDHSIWPANRKKLSSYGVEEVACLLDHFKIPLEAQGVNLLEAKREWEKLKLHISSHHQEMAYKEMWKVIFQRKNDAFPNILHLVAIVMVLPISNAQLERAFSAMGRILTDWRRSLKTSILSDLLLISMEGPENLEAFDAKGAVTKWLMDMGGKIRPNKKSTKHTQPVSEPTQEPPPKPAQRSAPEPAQEPPLPEPAEEPPLPESAEEPALPESAQEREYEVDPDDFEDVVLEDVEEDEEMEVAEMLNLQLRKEKHNVTVKSISGINVSDDAEELIVIDIE